MNGTELWEKMELLDDELIEESRVPPKRKPFWPLIAACLALAIGFCILAYPWQPVYHENVSVLQAGVQTSTQLSGMPSKIWTNGSSGSVDQSGEPPIFEFSGSYELTARVIDVLPDTYQCLVHYAGPGTKDYRILKMQVMDPLESNIGGEFWYALPAYLYCDMQKYDTLLIAMSEKGCNYLLKNLSTDQVTAFSVLFGDYQDVPQLGNIIAFSNGIFDESLWQTETWIYGYQFARHYLDEEDERLIVKRGISLRQALKRLEKQNQEYGQRGSYEPWNFTAPAALELLAYVKPFENGVFQSSYINNDPEFRRYINGCPTNERYILDRETQVVTEYGQRFTAADFENLLDVADYIEAMDLASLEAPEEYTDAQNRQLLSCKASGSYVKTDSGVVTLIRVEWTFLAEGWFDYSPTEQICLRLTEDGAKVMTQEEMKVLNEFY